MEVVLQMIPVLWLISLFAVAAANRPVGVRLVGGVYEGEGRVEVYRNGVWGTVCADDFNDHAASVVCYMLGYTVSTFMFPRKENSASFGRADNSPVILTNLYCSGLELDLASCHYDNVTTTYCGPSNARAAVKCIEDKAGDLDPEPPSKVHQLLGVFIILGVAGMACVVACVLCVVCWHKQCCCWDSSSRTMPEAHSTTTVCSSTGETRELRRSVNLHHCGQVNLAFSMDESAHRQDHTEREHRACSSSSDSFAQTMNFNNFHSIWSLNSAVISETVSGSPRQVPFRLQRPPSYSEIVRGDLPPTYEDAIKCV